MGGHTLTHPDATIQPDNSDAGLVTRDPAAGLEPHGVLPLSLVHFGNGGRLLPAALAADDRRRAFASTVIFMVPFVRVLWTWLGLRPASRTEISRHLTGAPPRSHSQPKCLTQISYDGQGREPGDTLSVIPCPV